MLELGGEGMVLIFLKICNHMLALIWLCGPEKLKEKILLKMVID